MIKEINGIRFDGIEVFCCSKCGNQDVVYEFIPTNKSIQAKCSGCGKFIKNMKQVQNIGKTKDDYKNEYLDNEAATMKQVGKIKAMLVGISKRTAMRIIDILEIEKKG